MKLKTLILTLSVLCCFQISRAQSDREWIQVSGSVINTDSTTGLPWVTVMVLHKNRGTYTNDAGVFSLPSLRGDTLQFSAIGFRDALVVVPENLEGRYFNVTQVLIQDTFYLPETVIRPIPFGKAFDYAFIHEDIAIDPYERARLNTSPQVLAYLYANQPKRGEEGQLMLQNMQAQSMYYQGQMKPQHIMNPLRWAEFFEAWKRGDFRKKY